MRAGRPRKSNSRRSLASQRRNGAPEVRSSPTLKVLRISKRQSSDWQKIAAIPEEKFEEILAASAKPVTTKAMLAAAAVVVPVSKTGVVQESTEVFEAARAKRRATAARFIEDGYAAAVAQDGDSAHFRTVRDTLLRFAAGIA